MSSAPRLTLSSWNWTPMTPTLSDAVAETCTVDPDTTAPFVGTVIVTVGDVVSGGVCVLKVEVLETAKLPATSRDFTTKKNVVFEASPIKDTEWDVTMLEFR